MIKLDFNTMTKKELRAYVIAHPSDKDAFRIFVDLFTVNTSSETFAMPQSVKDIQEIESLIQQKLEQPS
ncbi:MAG: hypothetical protein DCF19_05875 [Pseudanabaena frigida]|uniref:Uncharacterized protein n=1 Tax=Pseudanabaena frigida TaxID=945775 RepID=A0A2W4WEE1_9CYAN|nr:MAG: hypothetical protein DCF19_05875 [Pseudanabaena frigida]